MDAEDQPESTFEHIPDGADDNFAPLFQAMQKFNEGDLESAIRICKEIMQAAPDDPKPYFVMAIIAYKMKDLGQALHMAGVAHEMAPDIKEYMDILASISARAGRLTDAVYFGKLATSAESDPNLRGVLPPQLADLAASMKAAAPSMHALEGEGALNLGKYWVALREFGAELRINPENAMALIGLARSALAVGRQTQAIGALQTLLRLEPENMMAHALLARALVRVGRNGESRAAAMRAIKECGDGAEVYLQAMTALQESVGIETDTLKQIARDFAADFARENDMDEVERYLIAPEKPVHIGYMSNGFYRCPTAEFISPWFGVSPPKEFQISGYQQSIPTDTVTAQIMQGCTNWRKTYDVDPWTLAISLAADELDVLVDMSHPDGETQATAVALTSSAVRVGMTALPEPGLMPGITHVLSDETLADADRNMLLDGQELVVIEGSLYTRAPYFRAAEAPPLAASINGEITLGAMARLPHMSPDCAYAISDMLRAIPAAKLLLYGGDANSEESRLTIREYFLNAGVAHRVFFVDKEDDPDGDARGGSDFGRLTVSTSYWKEIDILVDTFPVTGMADICEALWNGVPTVTLRGQRRISSIGASIVAAGGRPNWIVRSESELVATVCDLAADVERLASEKTSLLKNIASSNLFDTRKSFERMRVALYNIAKQNRR